MVPFCRSIDEGKEIMKRIKQEKIKNTKVYVMAEIPSNVILADKFSEIFDGFSIGSNDLAQLILGVDRDNSLLSKKYDENNEAIRRTIADFLKNARKLKESVGICGEAPAIIPGFVEFLVENKIGYISVNSDSFVQTVKKINKTEKKIN